MYNSIVTSLLTNINGLDSKQVLVTSYRRKVIQILY